MTANDVWVLGANVLVLLAFICACVFIAIATAPTSEPREK